MAGLDQKTCMPCRGDVPALTPEESAALAVHVRQWSVVDNHHIERDYTFRNFVEALTFVNAVGEIAEEQGHHPDIYFTWGKARVTIWTHKINGLTESDFILAAKIDRLDALG